MRGRSIDTSRSTCAADPESRKIRSATPGRLLHVVRDNERGDRAARNQLDEFGAQFCRQCVVEQDERFIAIEHTRGSPRSHASNVLSKSSASIPSDLA
jgi:hypothetical protein